VPRSVPRSRHGTGGFGDRVRLEAIVKERNHSHKHVQRAQIVLLSADRLAVAEVARRVGVSRPAIWRWQ
jgi:transposase-like protein